MFVGEPEKEEPVRSPGKFGVRE